MAVQACLKVLILLPCAREYMKGYVIVFQHHNNVCVFV